MPPCEWEWLTLITQRIQTASSRECGSGSFTKLWPLALALSYGLSKILWRFSISDRTFQLMKGSEIFTILAASYGAILSSITLYMLVRSKRWRLKVTFDAELGSKGVIARALNLGERAITLKGCRIECSRQHGNIQKLSEKFLALYFGSFNESYPSSRFDVISEPTFPVSLEPGRSCQLEFDVVSLLEKFKSLEAFEPATARIFAVFEDEIGREYTSRAAPFTISSFASVQQ